MVKEKERKKGVLVHSAARKVYKCKNVTCVTQVYKQGPV